MARNQYDSDVTVWSPQGRLFQVEYAVEAVKLGSATAALKSQTHAILVGLKRSSELSFHQKKIIPIDKHIGVSIAGLTADARLVSKFLRTESLNHKFHYNEPIPISRLMTILGGKIQISTQRYDRRPYGVGLLVIGYDNNGAHVYEAKPNNVMCCKAMAIGSRSQSAKTYLEKNIKTVEQSNVDELIRHGLRTLRETLPSEQELTNKNVALAILGKDMPLKELTENEIGNYLTGILKEKRRTVEPIEERRESESREPDPELPFDSDLPPDDPELPPEPDETVLMDI